mmetsp:Transcript_38578/g.110349  ORF Transcript_38578/g.110349 Transcript_38578/m.110349 type:complete len:204 (-) Transcript_38578:758-1369(-)
MSVPQPHRCLASPTHWLARQPSNTSPSFSHALSAVCPWPLGASLSICWYSWCCCSSPLAEGSTRRLSRRMRVSHAGGVRHNRLFNDAVSPRHASLRRLLRSKCSRSDRSRMVRRWAQSAPDIVSSRPSRLNRLFSRSTSTNAGPPVSDCTCGAEAMRNHRQRPPFPAPSSTKTALLHLSVGLNQPLAAAIVRMLAACSSCLSM